MLFREFQHKLSVADLIAKESAIDLINQYFTRQDDHDQIRAAVKVRYGTTIEKVVDPNKPDTGVSISSYAPVSKEKFNAEVDALQTAAVNIGSGNRISNALASLFTEEGMSFTLQHETVEDVSKAEDLLNYNRERGGFDSALVRCDKKSVYIGSAAWFLSFSGGIVDYQVVTPADVRIYFPDLVYEKNEKGEPTRGRAPDKKNIEDAFAIVIRLSSAGANLWNYLAIIAACDEYPNGRHVTYQASNISTEIPKIGEEGSVDFKIGELECNPLTYVANQFPDLPLPEYPISILLGGTTESNSAMPWTSSLYDDAIEIDMGASHLHDTSQDAARGTNALIRDETGNTQPLPPTLRGDISLFRGQSLEHINHGAGESVEAMKVLDKLIVHHGAGYSVPDYMVVSEDYTVDSSSGIALEVKTRPLKKQRSDRIRDNRLRIKKMFDIEKSLIWLFSDEDEATKRLLFECEQVWEPGELRLPENKKETADRLMALLDKGIIDVIEAIREYHNCSTDQEAIDIYEKMQERATKYKPLNIDNKTQKKKQIGLLRNKNEIQSREAE